jgi:hypothetical protein
MCQQQCGAHTHHLLPAADQVYRKERTTGMLLGPQLLLVIWILPVVVVS